MEKRKHVLLDHTLDERRLKFLLQGTTGGHGVFKLENAFDDRHLRRRRVQPAKRCPVVHDESRACCREQNIHIIIMQWLGGIEWEDCLGGWMDGWMDGWMGASWRERRTNSTIIKRRNEQS